MKNDVLNQRIEANRNKEHIQDLQFRLDMVANNANNKKKRIGSTMPYAVVANREAKKQARLKRRQFGDFKSTVTGKSLTYLKDGEYLPR